MTIGFEDRLWAQLEAAALREERGGAAARGLFRARRMVPAFVALAVAVGAVAAVLILLPPRQAPQVPADRIQPRGTHLAAGVAAFGSLWAYDANSHRVLRLDARSHRVLASVAVTSPLSDVSFTVDGDALWMVPIEPIRHNVPAPARVRAVQATRIDPRSNRIVARVALRAPGGSAVRPAGVVALPGAAWVWGEGGALRIDPARHRVTGAVTAPGERIMGFAATDAQVTVATDLGQLVRFDARTGERLGAIPSRRRSPAARSPRSAAVW